MSESNISESSRLIAKTGVSIQYLSEEIMRIADRYARAPFPHRRKDLLLIIQKSLLIASDESLASEKNTPPACPVCGRFSSVDDML